MNSTLKGILLAVLVAAIAIVALGAAGVIHIPGLGNHEECGGHNGHDKLKACSGDDHEGHDHEGHADHDDDDDHAGEEKDAHEGHDHAEGEGHDDEM